MFSKIRGRDHRRAQLFEIRGGLTTGPPLPWTLQCQRPEPTLGREPMTIWGHVWQSSTRALDASERWRQKQKEPPGDLASSVADFVRNLFGGRFRLRCVTEPSIMAVAENVKAKMLDTAVVESKPRHSRATASGNGHFGQKRKTENTLI